MLKAYALRLHRWTTLVFALPLILVILSGFALSFLPLAQQERLDKPITREDVLGYLAAHDPDGKASGLELRTYEHALVIRGVGEDGETEIDLRTRDIMDDGGFVWSDLFSFARSLHETLLFDLGWLVTASTFAMLFIAGLGLAMGLPRLRNTLGGWHNIAAWGTLPLVILSPLTGLAIVYGVTFTPPVTGPRPAIVPIKQAVELIADKHDLNTLTSLRLRGGRLIARIMVSGAATNFVVSPQGLQETPRNWPRAIHEGNWSASLGPGLNILVSIVFMGLWTTGIIIWARRTLRMRRRDNSKAAVLQPAE